MNMQQLLSAMHDDDHTEVEALTDFQIANRLREFTALMDEDHRFKRGDVLVHKSPKQAYSENAEQPVVFLGYLDKPIDAAANVTDPYDFGSLSAAIVNDCRILTMKEGRAVPHLADSSLFKPHPDFPNT